MNQVSLKNKYVASKNGNLRLKGILRNIIFETSNV